MSHPWDNLVILWWEGSKRKTFGAAPVGWVLYNMQFCLILTTTVQRHQQLHLTCVWTGLSTLPQDVTWTVNVKLGFPLRASLKLQPMCSPCATMAQATILNWPSSSPSSLSKAQVFSKWAGGKALGIFSQQRLLNLPGSGVTRIPSFQWLSQAMNWRGGTWLGCGTGSHKAYGLLAMMHIPSQMGQDSLRCPFCENRARGRVPQGAAPGHNSHGLHGQRGSWSSDTPPSHSDRERTRVGSGGGGWDAAAGSRASSEGHSFKAAGQQCPGHSCFYSLWSVQLPLLQISLTKGWVLVNLTKLPWNSIWGGDL